MVSRSSPHFVDIDTVLEERHPGSWRRLTAQELDAYSPWGLHVGWQINISEGTVRAPEVSRFILAVDRAFPNSQPRILVPELGNHFRWPHVEPNGILCLTASSIEARTRDRVRLLLDETLRLLNFSDEQCHAEFRREFGSYWSQLASSRQNAFRILSLIKPSGPSRDVVFHFAPRQRCLIVADDHETLARWLSNAGQSASHKSMKLAILVRLARPWIPCEFPETVAQTLDGISDDRLRPVLTQHPFALFIFEAKTETGPVFAAILIRTDKLSKLKNGFRSKLNIPVENIKRTLTSQRIERLVVSRLDPGWVHGRDHSVTLKSLQSRKVAIIGCGSIGSEIASLLAKAGVGELMLLDHDILSPANLSRHFLGTTYLGFNKAHALAQELQLRFPHLRITAAAPVKFEGLGIAKLRLLAEMDLIVTAGLDIEGEAAVNAWRKTLDRAPAYVSTWVEAFCTAGHAVLLYGRDDLMSKFKDERPTFRLTDWPREPNHLIVEAGCGNVFQPHGAADLLPTISMSTRLILDALNSEAPNSCRRIWYGERETVSALGGIVRDTYIETNTLRQFKW